MKEIYKPIKGYEDFYEISNLGNVKALERVKRTWRGGAFTTKEIILKPVHIPQGYFKVSLSKDLKQKQFLIHQLMAINFLNHKPNGYKLVVNHINFDRLDNRIENLEVITARQNTDQKHLKSSSEYVGVSWNTNAKKWRADITINKKLKYLGIFEHEIDARDAYKKELKKLELC